MMKLENINFNIPFTKNDGCILIKAKEWENDGRLVQAYNMKGERCISYINKVLKINANKDIYGNELSEGDLVFISRQASRISYLRPYKITGLEGEFANVHLLQVIGKFQNNVVSYDNFTPIYNKIFMKKIEVDSNSILDLGDSCKTVIGKVLKVGTNGFNEKWEKVPLQVEVGKYVLVRDNITTEITLDGEEYIATEDNMVVGYFNIHGDYSLEDFSLDNLVLYGNNILMERFEEEKIEGSSLFFKPFTVDDSVSDITELYTDNRFKVVGVNSKNVSVNVGDKVIADNDYANDVTIAGKQYALLDGTRYIYAKFN